MKSVNQRIREFLIMYCVCDCLFHGYPFKYDIKMMLQCLKNYGIQLLISDGLLSVSFKSEMLIFEMALVIKHYI